MTKPFSLRRILRPCFELLWTNIFSDTTFGAPPSAGKTEVETDTWNLRISLGLPAFFKQFWLHLRKNFSWYLKIKIRKKWFFFYSCWYVNSSRSCYYYISIKENIKLSLSSFIELSLILVRACVRRWSTELKMETLR